VIGKEQGVDDLMHPVLLQVGGFSLYSWGVMVALGFVAGIAIALLRAKKEGLPAEFVMDGAMYVIISAMIGARIFYVIGFWSEYKDNLWNIFAVWEGGMVFYGGLIFAVIALFIWSRGKNIDLMKVLDLAAPSVAIGYSIGRIGCFLRGCCFGIECDLPFAVHFPESQGFVHPTQLYSALAGLLIFTALVVVRENKKYDGQVFIWGVILYSIYRFIIEFFRYNSLQWLWFSPSQWISAAIFLLGMGALVYRMLSSKRRA